MPSADDYHLQLRRRELPEASLKQLADAVADLDGKGFSAREVFPLGIVIQDGAVASFEVGPEKLGDLVGEIARLKDLRAEIGIFPLGVIALDRFEVRATIGRGGR